MSLTSSDCWVPPYISHMGHMLFTAALLVRLRVVCISRNLGHVTLYYTSCLKGTQTKNTTWGKQGRGVGLELWANHSWNTWARVTFKLSCCMRFLLSAGTTVLKSFGVQMLQQLFEFEMCMRETKNRMRTPLSQLPLHCLWDCLCVSPSLLFQSSCSPLLLLTQWLLLPPPPLYFPTFLSLWIRPCMSG